WPASRRASREGRAKAPVPRKTILTGLLSLLPVVGAGLLAELALHEVALERSQPVDEQETVDVVDLVAERAREQVVSFVGPIVSVGVETLDHDARGADGRAAEPGHGETAFLVALL